MPSAPSEYEKALMAHREAAEKLRNTENHNSTEARQLRRDKNRFMQEAIKIEREAANSGDVLTPEIKPDGRVVATVSQTDSKRSLQEEYVRKFDNEVVVELPDRPGEPAKKTTMRDFHKRRLFGKK